MGCHFSRENQCFSLSCCFCMKPRAACYWIGGVGIVWGGFATIVDFINAYLPDQYCKPCLDYNLNANLSYVGGYINAVQWFCSILLIHGARKEIKWFLLLWLTWTVVNLVMQLVWVVVTLPYTPTIRGFASFFQLAWGVHYFIVVKTQYTKLALTFTPPEEPLRPVPPNSPARKHRRRKRRVDSSLQPPIRTLLGAAAKLQYEINRIRYQRGIVKGEDTEPELIVIPRKGFRDEKDRESTRTNGGGGGDGGGGGGLGGAAHSEEPAHSMLGSQHSPTDVHNELLRPRERNSWIVERAGSGGDRSHSHTKDRKRRKKRREERGVEERERRRGADGRRRRRKKKTEADDTANTGPMSAGGGGGQVILEMKEVDIVGNQGEDDARGTIVTHTHIQVHRTPPTPPPSHESQLEHSSSLPFVDVSQEDLSASLSHIDKSHMERSHTVPLVHRSHMVQSASLPLINRSQMDQSPGLELSPSMVDASQYWSSLTQYSDAAQPRYSSRESSPARGLSSVLLSPAGRSGDLSTSPSPLPPPPPEMSWDSLTSREQTPLLGVSRDSLTSPAVSRDSLTSSQLYEDPSASIGMSRDSLASPGLSENPSPSPGASRAGRMTPTRRPPTLVLEGTEDMENLDHFEDSLDNVNCLRVEAEGEIPKGLLDEPPDKGYARRTSYKLAVGCDTLDIENDESAV